ncbi:MAG: GNAT family N-acetyltransferase [Planctomycetaceae bacterium]|jgi:GNAT superfamily N-acetyltransferase
MTDEIEIVHALPDHTDDLAPLFDAYRCWYGKSSDLAGAQGFIRQRLTSNESEIFFARRQHQPVAFTQLYPTFSSVSMGRVWILNDLYVVESVRREGVGTVLLETAAEFARALGAVRLQLETKQDNVAALAAYEALGWTQDSDFLHYSLDVSETDD